MNRYVGSPRREESGFVIVLVMVLLTALLAAGAVAMSLQVGSTRQGSLVKSSRSALYCAEAGLQAARDVLVSNRSVWNALLDADPANNPPWYPITGDIDTPPDGQPDYTATISDDGDDTTFTTDSNDTVIVVSLCTKYTESPVQVKEVISLLGQGYTYRDQAGQGPGNTGNAN